MGGKVLSAIILALAVLQFTSLGGVPGQELADEPPDTNVHVERFQEESAGAWVIAHPHTRRPLTVYLPTLEHPARREVVDAPVVASCGVSTRPGVEQWRGLVSRYFPPDAVEMALILMSRESGGDPLAVSCTSDYGLMQINAVHRAKAGGSVNALLDPETNIRVAAMIYLDQGWSPWSTYR